MDDIEWDFAEVAMEIKPLFAFSNADDFFEGEDLKLDGWRVLGAEGGHGVEQAEEVSQ